MRIDLVEISTDAAPAIIEILGIGLNGVRGATPIVTKGVGIISPIVGENVTMFFTSDDINVIRVAAIVLGDPGSSVTYSILFGEARDTGTELVTGGVEVDQSTAGVITTVFTVGTIPAENWVWLVTTAMSGNVSELSVSLSH